MLGGPFVGPTGSGELIIGVTPVSVLGYMLAQLAESLVLTRYGQKTPRC